MGEDSQPDLTQNAASTSPILLRLWRQSLLCPERKLLHRPRLSASAAQ